MAIAVTDRIRRGESGLAPFALAWQEDMKIGYITVADLTARDAIEEWRRLAYMTVYVISEDKEYQLGSNLTIAGQSWTEKTYGVPADVVTEAELFDVNGFIQPQLIQNIFLNTSYVVASEAAMLALTSYTGNIFVRTDTSDVYIKLNNTNPALIGDFALASGGGAVLSVNGATGVVNVTISSLLAVPANQTAFDAAVEANTEVLAQGGAITTLQGNFTTLSGDLADLDDYVQTHLGLQSLAANVQTPTITEDGYVLKWDEGTTSFVLAAETPTSTTFLDNVFRINDNADPTKQVAFEVSGVSTATLRTLTIPNASGTVALTNQGLFINTAGTSNLTANVLVNPSTYNFEVAQGAGLTGFLSNKDKFRANQVVTALPATLAASTGFTLTCDIVFTGVLETTWSTTNIPTGGVTLYLFGLEYIGPDYFVYDYGTVDIPDGTPVVEGAFSSSASWVTGYNQHIIVVPNNTTLTPYILNTNLLSPGSNVDTGPFAITQGTVFDAQQKSDISAYILSLQIPLNGLSYYYELNTSGHIFSGPTSFTNNVNFQDTVTGNVSSFYLTDSTSSYTLFSLQDGSGAGFTIGSVGSGGGVTSSVIGQTTGTSVGELTIQAGTVGDSATLNLGAKGNIVIDAQYDSLFFQAGNVLLTASGGGYIGLNAPTQISGATTQGDLLTVDASGNIIPINIGTDTHVLTMVGGFPIWAAPTGGGGGGGGWPLTGSATLTGNVEIEGYSGGLARTFSLRSGVYFGAGDFSYFNHGASSILLSQNTNGGFGSNVINMGSFGMEIRSTDALYLQSGVNSLGITIDEMDITDGFIQINTKPSSGDAIGDVYYRNSLGHFTALAIGTAGQVLTVSGGLPIWDTPSGGIGGSTGATDNAILRANGTGGSTLQASAISIQDDGDLDIGTDAGTIRTVSATGSGPNVGLYFVTKGTGLVNFSKPIITEYTNGALLMQGDGGAGPGIYPFYVGAVQAGNFLIKGADGISGFTITGQNLELRGGDGYTVGNNAAGGVNIYGGTPNGSGAVGNINIALATDKLGFFAATPVVKQSAATDLQTFYDAIVAYGLMPAATLSGGGGYTNLTSFISQTAWRLFYSNDLGDVVELALGADGTYLKSNGAAAAPTWATPAGSGNVSKVGTPIDNQIGVWTGDGTIEGTTGLTYNGTNLQLTGDIGSTGTRITKGWFTDLQVTNAIAGSITGNAATVTTNANLTGAITSTGNATSLGSFTASQFNTALSDANLVTNSASANEIVKSDGTNIVTTGLSSPSAAYLRLGTSANATTIRYLDVLGSSADIDLQINSKGLGIVSMGSESGLFNLYASNFGVGSKYSNASANTVLQAFIIESNSTAGAILTGTGARLDFKIKTAAGGNQELGGAIDVVSTDLTDTNEDFDVVIRAMAAGAPHAERLRVISTGQLKLSSYTATGSFAGTPVGYLQFDASGNILTAALPAGSIGGSTGSVDNSILRADGTGGSTVQSSAFTISDAGDITMGISGTTAGTDRYIYAEGSSANINIAISPKGSGVVYLGGASGIYVGGSVDFIDGDIALSTSMNTTFRSPSISGNAYNLIIGGGSSSAANGNGGHFYLDNGKKHGTGVDGNIGLLTSSVANWQAMERGLFVADALTAPIGNPTSGAFFWVDPTTHLPKWRVPAGTVYTLSDTGGGGGDVATDAIWDAAGDLAVGSGANTAVKLTKGSNDSILRVNGSGTVEWTAPQTGYSITNVTTDRTFDADTATLAELCDVVGTLINDLKLGKMPSA